MAILAMPSPLFPKADRVREEPTYSVEKLGFSVRAFFRQLDVASENCR